ncbi:MAG: DUF4388 domain-containing protein [Smithellaceae bacterium]
MMEGAVKKDFKLISEDDKADATPRTEAGMKDELQRWPLFGLSVGSFLQVIGMEQQTCIMEVYHDADHWGHFSIVEGALYDAVRGSLRGEDAAMEMICWENVRLNIKQILNTSKVERTIEKNLMLLLMESTRRRDEVHHGGPDGDMEDAEELEELDELEDMDVIADDVERAKLEACLNILGKDMGGALSMASIASVQEGKVMASFNAPHQTAEAFLRLTHYLKNAFLAHSTAHLGDHYIMDLKGQLTLVVLIFGEYQWCVVFDNSKCTLGLFRNVIMPKVVKTFNEMNI